MAQTRVALTSPTLLTHAFEVGETLTDATGSVAVAVTDATGATVSSGNAAHASLGTYSYALAGQSAPARLTAAWSATVAGSAVVQTDEVEIVGGFFFSLTQGRASDASLSDSSKYTTGDLEDARLETEEECEAICDRAFIPRYLRTTLDGTGQPDLVLRHPDPERTVAHVRTIRSVKMARRADQPFVDFTTPELAALRVSDDGTLRRLDGRVFTEGYANVVVELEYGLNAPPAELVKAALMRFRTRLNLGKGQIPSNASSFTVADGGTYRLDLPGAWKTGRPEIDAVYARYSRRSGAGTGTSGRQVPASRQLNYDPQFASLFHGGRR